jgi:hypothetical protein
MSLPMSSRTQPCTEPPLPVESEGAHRVAYLPTPHDIEAACLAIQSKWSDKERNNRQTHVTRWNDISRLEANAIALPTAFVYMLRL